jgi:hypothetical protein
MGLDIYVGPLSRYYAGDWETVIQRWGRENGTPITMIRPPGHRFPSLDDALQAVLTWRLQLEAAFGDLVHEPLDWSEDPTGDYSTDKPGFDGRSAVLLLAAQQEFPSMTLPSIARDDIRGTSLWDLVMDRYSSGNLRRRIRERLGLGVKIRPAGPFEHLYLSNMWLPVDFELTGNTLDPFGRPVHIGSVPRLRRQLQDLHDRVEVSHPGLLEANQMEGTLDRKEFPAVASFGLKTWLDVAIEADERGMPMILDS